MKKPLTLKEAIQTNKLEQFIAEHSEMIGDKSKFDSTLDSMVGKLIVNQSTSSKARSDN